MRLSEIRDIEGENHYICQQDLGDGDFIEMEPIPTRCAQALGRDISFKTGPNDVVCDALDKTCSVETTDHTFLFECDFRKAVCKGKSATGEPLFLNLHHVPKDKLSWTSFDIRLQDF